MRTSCTWKVMEEKRRASGHRVGGQARATARHRIRSCVQSCAAHANSYSNRLPELLSKRASVFEPTKEIHPISIFAGVSRVSVRNGDQPSPASAHTLTFPFKSATSTHVRSSSTEMQMGYAGKGGDAISVRRLICSVYSRTVLSTESERCDRCACAEKELRMVSKICNLKTQIMHVILFGCHLTSK